MKQIAFLRWFLTQERALAN